MTFREIASSDHKLGNDLIVVAKGIEMNREVSIKESSQ
jgi:hypothetical protein